MPVSLISSATFDRPTTKSIFAIIARLNPIIHL
jgi:hypothetical protein